MTPVVSVMVPCYQAAATLPMALASAMCQTWSDWECVCVDDGSRDATWEVLERARMRDSRIRTERFSTNRGRGAARQRCLELARGRYLAFLDADDWMYPSKLGSQVAILDRDPTLALVSTGASITDCADRAVGMSRRGSAPGQALTMVDFDAPEPPQLLFPTSMVRLDEARAVGFDPAFRRSQDSDFLIRLLLGRRYAVSKELLYAYSQASAASVEKTIEGYGYRIRSHLRHVRTHPARVLRTVATTGLKALAYRAVGDRGAAWLIRRRWQAVDAAALEAFRAAFDLVAERRRAEFGD